MSSLWACSSTRGGRADGRGLCGLLQHPAEVRGLSSCHAATGGVAFSLTQRKRSGPRLRIAPVCLTGFVQDPGKCLRGRAPTSRAISLPSLKKMTVECSSRRSAWPASPSASTSTCPPRLCRRTGRPAVDHRAQHPAGHTPVGPKSTIISRPPFRGLVKASLVKCCNDIF